MWTMNARRCLGLALLLAILMITGPALGQNIFIYPTRGQSPQQQDRDRYECHSWAVQQTGFDPSRAQTAQAPPPSQEAPQGGVLRGAAGGAALGAVGGAISGNAGKGAAVGAAMGGLFGGMRRAGQKQRQQQEQAAYAAQQQQAAAQGQGAYNRAIGACLSGRGYTVQ